MICIRRVLFFGRVFAVCMLAWCCAGLLAESAPVYAANPALTSQPVRKAPSRNATRSWNFRAPDRSFQHSRWRDALNAELRGITFAPFAPAERYLQHNGAAGMDLPPIQLEELEKMRPQENSPFMLGGSTAVSGEFTKERTGWRVYNDDEYAGLVPVLKEEGRAGLYAGFRPDEAVELKLGPEYYLGSSVMRPDQTGYVKDAAGVFGLGMKLKIDF